MGQTGDMDGPQNVLALPQTPDAIELRHLRAFVAVAEELSFSRAAQRLFITQPALSRQIRGLERLVGCDLFRRSTQRVELTLAGEALLARARVLLADLDDAISVTRSVGGELAGRMAVLWEPWARASADVADLDGIRAALEELHGKFTPPPDVAIAPVIAGGVPALRIAPAAASRPPCCTCTAAGTWPDPRSATVTWPAPSPPRRGPPRWSSTTGSPPSTPIPPPCRTRSTPTCGCATPPGTRARSSSPGTPQPAAWSCPCCWPWPSAASPCPPAPCRCARGST